MEFTLAKNQCNYPDNSGSLKSFPNPQTFISRMLLLKTDFFGVKLALCFVSFLLYFGSIDLVSADKQLFFREGKNGNIEHST